MSENLEILNKHHINFACINYSIKMYVIVEKIKYKKAQISLCFLFHYDKFDCVIIKNFS